MLLTIDPGNDTGWALWDGTNLIDCGLGLTWRGFFVARALIESPVVYPRSKVPPNDIVKLARLVGEYGGYLKHVGTKVDYVEPATWKGQTPKDVHNKRTKAKVKAKLSKGEQDLVRAACKAAGESAAHNVLDAVGLGVWFLKI